MRVSILTSSRADFGIYLPLIQRMKVDSFFELNVIAFGTHTSIKYGQTINNIKELGFSVNYEVETVVGDSSKEISFSMAKNN